MNPGTAPLRPGPHARLPGLDALRAFSIGWVVCFHLYLQGTPFLDGWIRHLVAHGADGVMIFFVLSGFLITWLLLEEAEESGTVDLRRFYGRRILRILPPALAYLAFASIAALITEVSVSPIDWVSCVLFFRNLGTGHRWTGHFWSLSVEEQFYLAWPALFLFLPKRHRLAWVVGLVLFAPLWRHLVAVMGWMGPLPLAPNRTDLIYDNLLGGAALALAQRSTWFRGIFGGSHIFHWSLFFVATGCFLSDLPAALARWPSGMALAPTAKLVCVLVVIKLLVEGRCGWLQQACALRPVVWTGQISYSLYLWQQIFCIGKEGWWIQQLPWNVLASIICAAASFYLVERGSQRLRDRLWPREMILK